MKKVIEGKLYNTDTAKLVESYGYGNPGDLEWMEEGLYLSKKGQFFVAGEGGPKSKYFKIIGQQNWSGGEGCEPISKELALEWMEAYGTVEMIEIYFKDIEEA
ncbi:hypothetical protein LCGC14_2664330 [marine sediment metagenome]|uniref:Uncharacterized protein n=1 Tax=marine sediment metagenome TaxID=412755 RepID=A0A0F9ADD0_9ZZZZ